MTATPALDLLAGLVLPDGRRWGEAAVEVQWADARAVLGGGRPYHFLTRSRGYSKTSDLAGLVLAAMLTQLPPASRCYALAADRDQGRLLVDSLQGFESRTPMLAGAVRVDAFKVTATRSGSTLEVLAADAPGAYGLRPAFLVVDELAMWLDADGPRRLWEAVASAMTKVPGGRMVALTSAGDPTHWSYKVLTHARTDPLWRVHEVAGPPPWADPDRLEEQRRRLPESAWRRLFLNEWVAAEDRLVRPEDLAAAVTLDGPLQARPGVSYRIGCDLGLRHDRTAIAVAHAEHLEGTSRARRVVLDRMRVFAGSRASEVRLADVEEALVEVVGAYRGRIVLDPWQAIGLRQRLEARGCRVEEYAFSPQSVGRLASTLHVLLRDRLLALPADPDLLDELAHVRLRETSPGVLRMDHDPSRHDDRAVALALAALGLTDETGPSPGETNARLLLTTIVVQPTPGLEVLRLAGRRRQEQP